MADEPIRSQTATMHRSAMKYYTGTLLLYPDRLSHVVSGAMGAAVAGGVLAKVVTDKRAKNKASEKEAAGGKGLTTLALAEVVTLTAAGRQVSDEGDVVTVA